ncbi:hypothetical protein K439DRAFT_1512215 [Ramaria rubella]|nr:hypothetical protein K439DRAFT_1512215 [Ramaria rubella]
MFRSVLQKYDKNPLASDIISATGMPTFLPASEAAPTLKIVASIELEGLLKVVSMLKGGLTAMKQMGVLAQQSFGLDSTPEWNTSVLGEEAFEGVTEARVDGADALGGVIVSVGRDKERRCREMETVTWWRSFLAARAWERRRVKKGLEVCRSSGIECTRDLAHTHADKAKEALEILPESDAKAALQAVTEQVVQRKW